MNRKQYIDAVLQMMLRPSPRFFGERCDPFDALAGFAMGFDFGLACAAMSDSADPVVEFVPVEFGEFVGRELGADERDEKGWEARIRESTGSGEEAFRLFVELRLRFEDLGGLRRETGPPDTPP